MPNYYSTVPSLAYIFNHFFWNFTHYTWVASQYYPYRLPNPKSSNPHLIYQDLYQAWKDNDEFDKFVLQSRLNLRAGLLVMEKSMNTSKSTLSILKKICDEIDIAFFYPLVYRVKTDSIASERLERKGSALAGSEEYLISNLHESEIDDIIFLDCQHDADLTWLVFDEYSYYRKFKKNKIDPSQALILLESRCKSNAHGLESTVSSTSGN